MRHRIAAWELTFVTAAGHSGRDRTPRALGQPLDRSCTLRGMSAHLRDRVIMNNHATPARSGRRLRIKLEQQLHAQIAAVISIGGFGVHDVADAGILWAFWLCRGHVT